MNDFIIEKEIAKSLGIKLSRLLAVAAVESTGDYELDGGKIVCLLERHKVYLWIKKNHGEIKAASYASRHPDVINPKAGGYGKYSEQYARVAKVVALGFKEAAHWGASWGAFQLMGFHFEMLGFNSAVEMVEYLHDGNKKEKQLRLLSVFLKKYDAGGALDSLRRDDFSRFAEIYNGSDYRKNEYDTKLKEFSERFEKLD
jgi:hypothetical protein